MITPAHKMVALNHVSNVLGSVLDGARASRIAGVNIAVRHRKPTQANPQGGLEKVEAPLHVSKVALEDPKTGKPTRVRFETRDGKKVRVAARSGELING